MTAAPGSHKEVSPGAAQGGLAVVVGGGPAGLRAAEVLAEHGGWRVTLCEQKPSVGRKFLVAGKGGLNLTHSEALPAFISRYGPPGERWRALLEGFGPAELRAWAGDLGVETYVGTSGRVFPKGQQSAALLRRWVSRLRALGVDFRVRQRLESLRADGAGGWLLRCKDAHSGGETTLEADAVVLALGGASWPQTGSDGRWPSFLGEAAPGVRIAPWQPANCGWEVAWDPRLLAAAEGQPLKNIRLTAGERSVLGEVLITRYGLEGGAIYQCGRELRAADRPTLRLDLKPEVSEEAILQRLPAPKSPSWSEIARRLKLGAAARALLEFHGPAARTPGRPALAAAIKNLTLELREPRPIAEAISSAGGMDWAELDADLMLARLPGVFLAGEMIDWEAPTGGYLLQGSFATGSRAGLGAANWLSASRRSAHGQEAVREVGAADTEAKFRERFADRG